MVSGVAGYAFQLLGTRSLSPPEFASLGVLWSVLFLVSSIALLPMEALLVRAAGEQVSHASGRHGAAIVRWILGTTLATILLLAVGRGHFYPPEPLMLLVAASLVLTFGGFFAVRGILAAFGRFTTYAVLTAVEGLSRLAGAGVAVALGGGAIGFGWALAAGPVPVLVWCFARRRHLTTAADTTASRPALPSPRADSAVTEFLAISSGANAISQVLLAGGPLVVAALGAPPAVVGVFFVTLTGARIPLVLVMNGLLARVLAVFVRLRGASQYAAMRTAVWRLLILTAVTAVIGGALGWQFGPPAVALVFGRDFTPTPWWAASAAAGALLATGNHMFNQILISTRSERSMVLPWGAGLAVAIVILAAVPTDAADRTALAFVAGELVALLLLLTRSLIALRDPPYAETGRTRGTL